MTDKEIKRFWRFMKSAEQAWEINIYVRGQTREHTPFVLHLVKNHYTSGKLKLQLNFNNYCEATPWLTAIEINSRYITSIKGTADYPRGMEKDIGGKIYHYNKKTFTKYFQRTNSR